MPTPDERLATLEEQLNEAQAQLEALQESSVTGEELKKQNRVVADLAAKVRAIMARMGMGTPKPVLTPVPDANLVKPLPPTPEPPEPAGSAPQIQRGREDVTRILLEELAKITSFVPGYGDVTGTNSAIQLHTDDVIAKLNALQVPEPILRPQIAARWQEEIDLRFPSWPTDFPPVVTTKPTTELESKSGPTVVVNPAPAIITKPAPPIEAGGRWSREMIDEAIRQIVEPNQGKMINIPDKEGWYRRGSVVMGIRPRDLGRPDWAPNSRFPDEMFWPFFNWWCVVFREVGDPGGGVVQVRRMDDQFKWDKDWVRLKEPSNKIGWGAYYKDHFEYWPGRDLPEGGDSVYQDADSVSVRVKDGTCAHFMSGSNLIQVPNVELLEGYLATCEVRLDPERSNPDAKLLFQAGADAKPAAASSQQNG